MAAPKRKIYYSPSPGNYAVIRLNSVEMVRPLDDPLALAEAQAMRTKSYLIMLELELALPMPDRPWYMFNVNPIAPCLGAEDPERGLTSDMCTPIFPNTSHPNGRPPVRPEGHFPYSNCYHWVLMETTVRVRARQESFDETDGVSLSVLSRMEMMNATREDSLRSVDNMEAHGPLSVCRTEVPRLPPGYFSRDGAAAGNANADHLSTTSGAGSSFHSTDEDSVHSIEELGHWNIFGGPNDDVELVPLLDLWVSEFTERLNEEDIPSPLELLAEFDEVIGIVQRARVRAYAALTAPEPKVDHSIHTTKLRRFLPAKTWNKACSRANSIAVRLKRRFIRVILSPSCS
ncbi:hypothetical protein FKP32DRAFT_1673043 [Trametes sanguinea]|nr:hypothetical protein FKP32DRAFT_1673043 [Trametes sanguinea]